MRPRVLEKLWRLPAGDRLLLIGAVILLSEAKLALWLLPVQVARRLLARSARRVSAHDGVIPDRIGWAISRAGRIVPRASCLPQALVAEALLTRFGHAAKLRIGVVKTERGRLVAHAWVECNGEVIVGELHDRMSDFTPLPPLPGAGI